MSQPEPKPVGLDFKNPDPGVQRIVEFLELGERTVLYTYLVKFRRFANPRFAYTYALAALLILVAFLSTSASWRDTPVLTRSLIVVVPLYRLWDIVRWWVDLLVDRRHYMVVSRERNLIFLALNLLEVVFVGAILFSASGVSRSTSGAWFDSFFLVTQLAFPTHGSTFWGNAATALIEFSSLVLLLGGLSTLVDLIGSKLKEGAWHGPHGHPERDD
jgi:hypothetical protein